MALFINSAIYAKELKSHLPGLFYFVFVEKLLWKKKYLELLLVVQYFKKINSLFYKQYSNKLTTTFFTFDIISPITKPIIKPTKLTYPKIKV